MPDSLAFVSEWACSVSLFSVATDRVTAGVV
jgi:hypothetical protein